jgi:hypothetical protein
LLRFGQHFGGGFAGRIEQGLGLLIVTAMGGPDRIGAIADQLTGTLKGKVSNGTFSFKCLINGVYDGL